MANIKDIAKKAGLSVATVSRVFNNSPLVKPKTRNKVLKVAKEMDYQHNIVAAALRSGKSKIIGVVVPEIGNTFFAAIINGIEKKLKCRGYNLIIAQSHESAESQNDVLSSFQRLNVDGVLMSVAKEKGDFGQTRKMIDRKIPFVFFDRMPEGLDQINSVLLDDHKGAFMATQHLIDKRCRQLVHIAGHSSVPIFNARKKGFEEAVSQQSGVFGQSIEFNEDMSTNKILIEQLFEQYPDIDGFFAHGDVHALYLLDVLKQLDVRVPDQVKVIGFGNADFSAHVTPRLSTIDQNCDQMGQLAAETLLNQIEAEEVICAQQVLLPRMILRNSTE
ncbi:MAG: LacI family DNA-binding transcriptional regulator [Cytophagales bacterium]|nr:LacI family DNA-binding transcriptional regulator [Cytophagales bacterium]